MFPRENIYTPVVQDEAGYLQLDVAGYKDKFNVTFNITGTFLGFSQVGSRGSVGHYSIGKDRISCLLFKVEVSGKMQRKKLFGQFGHKESFK